MRFEYVVLFTGNRTIKTQANMKMYERIFPLYLIIKQSKKKLTKPKQIPASFYFSLFSGAFQLLFSYLSVSVSNNAKIYIFSKFLKTTYFLVSSFLNCRRLGQDVFYFSRY